ncbi:MAG: TfuA-like protein [Gammaproteobacteria bacterium]
MSVRRALFIESTISIKDLQPYVEKSDLVLPGIRRGDLIDLHIKHPSIQEVIIVDGVFEQCPSITHKEILWLISKNVKVVGIASIGALRAYELRDHGMEGYGWVYEQYLNGAIDGDDEVAVSYNLMNPEATKTIAMVNLRMTSINDLDKKNLHLMKSIHFKSRTWKRLYEYLPASDVERIKDNYIDIKKIDLINYLNKRNIHDDLKYDSSYISNIFFEKMKISYTGVSLTKFINNRISDTKENKYDVDGISEDELICICRFLLLPQLYIPKIKSVLYDYNGIDCNTKKISNFFDMVREEFNINSRFDLLNLLKNRNISVEKIDKLFHNLAKLFEILIL